MQQRHFTSGSRQAPDPFDQFLEEHHYYRKHTARDASCLFRVIAEQMYDTQLHHLVIREKCVTYMRKHRKFFEGLVDRDLDEYLDDMSKPKTYGTLLELQAAGYLFQRNVFLFEPFNLGNYFNGYRSYFKEDFRVFYTPERHFDSVFTSEYIEEAAICQSICYEILYKDLFKLPDVSFAVEQMLHGPSFDNMEYGTDTNEDGYATRLYLNDGRAFELDLPNTTNCILENHKLCHFHYSNFPRFSDDLLSELKGTQADDNEKNILLNQRTAESFLPNKYISCVRQLLQEGITPFPYKVAKALDPNMYRNIEFDSWNEMRKELKFQNWYNGDTNFKLIRYHTKRVRKIFQVGAKCHVKLRKSEQDIYTCHIQEIAVDKGQCIVFIEQLGEKRLVPYENLTPLPPDQFKPWTVPYRFQRQMQKFSSVRFTRQYNYRFKFNATTEHHHHQQYCGSGGDNDCCFNEDDYNQDYDPKRQLQLHNQKYSAAASYYKLKRYTHLENFRTHTVEFCTMPLTVEHNAGGEYCDSTKTGSGQQQRGSADMSECSRATSRSSNTLAAAGPNNALEKAETPSGITPGEDHLCTPIVGFGMPHGEGVYDLENYNPGTAIFVPELQSFCHMYPYATAGGMPEDYYGYYGYDGSMAPAPTYMSTLNGYYYVCSNGPAPPGSYLSSSGNPYVAGHPAAIGLQAPPQNVPVYANAAPQYTPAGAALNGPICQIAAGSTSSVGGSQNREPNSPLPRLPPRPASNQNVSNTPLSGRINYEAKKSLKANGSDLPNDKPTLRFFYNLGLDYYKQKQSKQSASGEEKEAPKHSQTAKDSSEQLATDLGAIRLDENGNQIGVAAKSDANNNALLPEAATTTSTAATNFEKQPSAIQNASSNKNTASSNSSAAGGGNKTNQRRYNSRYFSGKDRQMSHSHQQQHHRNNHHMNSNSNINVPYNGSSQQHHNHNQQQQHQSSTRNQGSYKNNNLGGGGGHYQTSTTPNTGRSNAQQQHHHQASSSSHQQQHQQHHPNHQQFLPPNHAAKMTEQCVQTSPLCGYDEALAVMAANDNHQCNTPTTNTPNNNPFAHGAYGGNDALCGAQLAVPLAGAAGGVYVPVPMTAAPGPPPPYGLYAPHPTPLGYQTNSGHPNFLSGPMHIPPPNLMHGVANSVGSGSECTDNNGSNSDMLTCNGFVNVGNGLAPPLQCTSYPPPPMPFYLATGGAVPPPPNVVGGNGGGPNGNAGVHLIAQMAPATPTSHNIPQPFTAPPHSSMGPQGYFCLPTAQTQMPPSQQQQQQMQQASPMINNNNNRGGVPVGAGAGVMGMLSDSITNPNNNCARTDKSVNNE